MRALIGLVILGILFYVTAVAQFADPSPADEPVEEGQPINQRAPEDWLAMCLADWDSQNLRARIQRARVLPTQHWSVTSIGSRRCNR